MKQKNHRIISLVLVCALLTGCSSISTSNVEQSASLTEAATPLPSAAGEASDNQAVQQNALPQPGDELSGFVVEEVIPMNVLNATGIRFTHSKSGATLLYLASEDTNRLFDISFRTPTLDDKGKPHIFEHITISGSQKYPDANLFFPFVNQTYNTFVNAFTCHGMTTFPVASLSEKQLMSMMDYYLSSVFHPLLYTEPRLAQREAWRYELTDVNEDIKLTGTVYNEMQGAFDLSRHAETNLLKTLYEGSTTAYCAGGVPEVISTLSYEELLNYHETYYHPSNALITLYGKLDIVNFLSFIDSEYLSAYEKKDIQIDMGKIEPYTETKYAEYAFPVERGTSTEKASDITYGFACNGADMYDSIALLILSQFICQESSPVMHILCEKLPTAMVNATFNFDVPSAPAFYIQARGVDPSDRDTLVSAVEEGLALLRKEGISADALDSVIALNKLNLRTTAETQDWSVYSIIDISIGWTYFDSVEFYNIYEKVLNELTVEKAQTLIDSYLTDNQHRAVIITRPEPGLVEEKAAALATELAEIKAALSTEEIKALKKSSDDYMQWANTPHSKEILSQIVNLKVAELPEDVQHHEIQDETKDGVRYLSISAEVNDVYKGTFLLDAQTIPIENLQDAQFYLYLLGKIDTNNHTKEELSSLISRYLKDFSATLMATKGYGEGNDYYSAQASWTGLSEDVSTSTTLFKELLYETKLSDTEAIKSLLTRWSTDFSTSLNTSPVEIQRLRCHAMFTDAYAYNAYVSDHALYVHAQELIALAEADPDALTARLEAARALLLNKTNGIILCTGNKSAIDAFQKEAEKLLSGMPSIVREKVNYSSLRIPKKNEALVNDTTVQYNMLFADNDSFSIKDYCISLLIDDTYLLPQLRNVCGAYGAFTSTNTMNRMLYTYRDPNLAESYAFFEELPHYLEHTDLTQDVVDSYIIGCYSNIVLSSNPLSDAQATLYNYLSGITEEMKLQWLKEVKATTVNDVVASADTWKAFMENAVRSSSGTESTLLKNAELFDVLVYPDGTIKELH